MIDIEKRRRAIRDKRATLADVARAAAVSTASVSRALTRPGAVSEQLRSRVFESATALGYVPNGAARALVRRRSGLIGVVAGDLEKPGMGPALAAIDERLTGAGWALIVASGGTDGAPIAQARALVGRGIEALVFLGVKVPIDLGGVPGIARVPSVSVDRTDETGVCANAGLDLGRAGKLVADYLVQLGHRHLAVVAEADSVFGTLADVARRGDGGSPPFTLGRLSIGEESLPEGLLRWSLAAAPPTAAICSSDAVALALMHACAVRGIAVPGRLSVVGLGDTPLARSVSPTLTSVRIPGRGAGLAAAEYLLARFAGASPAHVELPIKVAVRGSTAPPRP